MNIKECPFCFSGDVFIHHVNDSFFVECDTCGATGPLYEMELEAIEVWNAVTEIRDLLIKGREDK